MIRIDYYKIWEWIYFWIKSRNTTKWHDNYSLVVKRNEQIRAIECMKCADCLHVFSLPILDLEYVKVIDCLMTGCRIEEPNNLVLISADRRERVKMHHKFCMWCQFMLTICVCWLYVPQHCLSFLNLVFVCGVWCNER